MTIDEELRKARDDAESAAWTAASAWSAVVWSAESAAESAAWSAASAWSAVVWSAESAVCVEDIDGELDAQIDLILEEIKD